MEEKYPSNELSAHWRINRINSLDQSCTLRYATYTKHGGKEQEVSSWIVFLNGRSEFIEKYHDLPEDLQLSEKIGFLTWDHRGQGDSQGLRSHIKDYNTYAQDSLQIIEKVTDKKPYVIVSHSMGALIALFSTLKGDLNPKGLLLSSPFLGVPEKPLPRFVSQPLCSFLTTIGLTKTRWLEDKKSHHHYANNPLTTCSQKFLRIKHSPYGYYPPTFGWIEASFVAIDYIFAATETSQLQVPVKIIETSQDRVIHQPAIRDWLHLAVASGMHINHRVFREGQHELFAERPSIYQEVIHEVSTWLVQIGIT